MLTMIFQSEKKRIIVEVLIIIAFIAVEQIDARYFIPKMREWTLNSSVDCHDDLNKCWMKNTTKKEAAK